MRPAARFDPVENGPLRFSVTCQEEAVRLFFGNPRLGAGNVLFKTQRLRNVVVAHGVRFAFVY